MIHYILGIEKSGGTLFRATALTFTLFMFTIQQLTHIAEWRTQVLSHLSYTGSHDSLSSHIKNMYFELLESSLE